jgi:hypothetical protein
MRFSSQLIAVVLSAWLAAFHGYSAVAESDRRETLISWIRAWKHPPESLPLEAVVEGLLGRRALDWQDEEREGLAVVADTVLRKIRNTPLSAARPNEVGYQLEEVVAAEYRALNPANFLSVSLRGLQSDPRRVSSHPGKREEPLQNRP